MLAQRGATSPAFAPLKLKPVMLPTSSSAKVSSSHTEMVTVSLIVGIITGTRSYNPLFSSWIPGPDDGKVSVASARLDGMQAFRTVDASHTFIMRNAEVIELTRRFLQTGHFDATEP